MSGIQQTGILALQPQEPVNVPTPPEGSFYMFVNLFDGITYYKDWNRVCRPISNLPATLPNNQIFVGNALNVATPVPVTGDVTLTNTGLVRVVAIQSIPVAPGPYTIGTMLYFDGVNWQKLLPGINGQVLTMVAGVPTWV
jgi:hypothetical protein